MFLPQISTYIFFFFFSSRRRHTRLTCDWSSDVCSSDLARPRRPAPRRRGRCLRAPARWSRTVAAATTAAARARSEEHTSELQSHVNLVCRLLLEKKKKKDTIARGSTTNTSRLLYSEGGP